MRYTFGMHLMRLALLLLLIAPLPTLAAGFAKQSLFLSTSPVVEGDSVLIYSVVQNDDASKFDGNLIFFSQKDGGDKEKIGTVAAGIAPHGADTISISWKPLAGTYTITAELTQQDGTIVESESERFTINEKPKPAAQESADGVESSADVAAMLANYVPALAGPAAPVFSSIDSLRQSAVSVLNQGLDWSKSKVGENPAPGQVLGAATKDPSPQGLLGAASNLAALMAFYFFSALKWVVANTGVFYPVLAILFLFGLWKLFSHIRRPSY